MRKGTIRYLKRKVSHRLKGQSRKKTKQTKNKFLIQLFGGIVIKYINMIKYDFIEITVLSCFDNYGR